MSISADRSAGSTTASRTCADNFCLTSCPEDASFRNFIKIEFQQNMAYNARRVSIDRNQLWGIFRGIDRNGDGNINADELQLALKNGSWTEFNPETVRLMIGMFDADRNGTIDFNEFFALWQYVTDWSDTFHNYDLDQSGAIDKRELVIALKSFGYNVSDFIVNILLRRFDRTGTGEIRFDDFIQLCSVLRMLTEGFKQHDRNLNGWVDLGYEQFLTLVFSLRH